MGRKSESPDKIVKLKVEKRKILNRRPDLALRGDFSEDGSRLFEINSILKIQ